MDNYTSNLRKANSSYGKFTSACYALDLSAAVGALILVNIAFPPTVIVTIIGGGAIPTMVSDYFDSKEYFDAMKEWYSKAKVYEIYNNWGCRYLVNIHNGHMRNGEEQIC